MLMKSWMLMVLVSMHRQLAHYYLVERVRKAARNRGDRVSFKTVR